MHAPGKGMSSSALPYVRKAPNWSKNKVQKSEVVSTIPKLQKMGLRPSAIGVHLPEDLYFLIKKAVTMRKHLDKNRKDKHGKFRLILVESRIHRLARYYRTKAVIPAKWKYDSATAAALVS